MTGHMLKFSPRVLPHPWSPRSIFSPLCQSHGVKINRDVPSPDETAIFLHAVAENFHSLKNCYKRLYAITPAIFSQKFGSTWIPLSGSMAVRAPHKFASGMRTKRILMRGKEIL